MGGKLICQHFVYQINNKRLSGKAKGKQVRKRHFELRKCNAGQKVNCYKPNEFNYKIFHSFLISNKVSKGGTSSFPKKTQFANIYNDPKSL